MTTTDHRYIARDGHDACTCGVRGGMGYLVEHWLDVGREAAKGELVTLDDPRVRPGAIVRLEFRSESGKPLAYEGEAIEFRGILTACAASVPLADRIYLLAEAPDPDRDMR